MKIAPDKFDCTCSFSAGMNWHYSVCWIEPQLQLAYELWSWCNAEGNHDPRHYSLPVVFTGLEVSFYFLTYYSSWQMNLVSVQALLPDPIPAVAAIGQKAPIEVTLKTHVKIKYTREDKISYMNNSVLEMLASHAISKGSKYRWWIKLRVCLYSELRDRSWSSTLHQDDNLN